MLSAATQPLSSHCGHSYCTGCYLELLRHSARCALCREPLNERLPSVNVVLRSVIEAAFPVRR